VLVLSNAVTGAIYYFYGKSVAYDECNRNAGAIADAFPDDSFDFADPDTERKDYRA